MDELNLPHGGLTGQIIKGFLETYYELGSGFSERVSRDALAIVLLEMGLRVDVEVALQVSFRGQVIGKFFADMVVNETVLVEIKATTTLEPYAEAQLLNYLKAAGGGVGLILNFGRKPEYKRRVMRDPLNSLPCIRSGREETSAALNATAGDEAGPNNMKHGRIPAR